MFSDDKLSAAISDHIVHRGRLVELNGTSHSMSAALMLGKKEADGQRSGASAPEAAERIIDKALEEVGKKG